eukprot:TRINITY_DN28448_c0_g1_i1.p2 TRINITY_DN28448_c0_g1~~TRINITY_DN28448_c0_g1_i1.p2  ORF type:complete len:106 (+),score=0.08 TRINITY_DN28448_c0_g1_i1:44-361(+)
MDPTATRELGLCVNCLHFRIDREQFVSCASTEMVPRADLGLCVNCLHFRIDREQFVSCASTEMVPRADLGLGVNSKRKGTTKILSHSHPSDVTIGLHHRYAEGST